MCSEIDQSIGSESCTVPHRGPNFATPPVSGVGFPISGPIVNSRRVAAVIVGMLVALLGSVTQAFYDPSSNPLAGS